MDPYPAVDRLLFSFFALALLVIVGALLVSLREPIMERLDAFNVLPKEEALTELYFKEIPTVMEDERGKNLVSFSFVVSNHEGAETAYAYQVALASSSEDRTIITEDSFSLEDGDVRTVDISFPSTQLKKNTHIEVSLLDRRESLRYRLIAP